MTYHEDRSLIDVALLVFDLTIFAVLYLLDLDVDFTRRRVTEHRSLLDEIDH